MTNDGKYYVAVFYPITTALLPTDPNTVLAGQSYDDWSKTYTTYLANLVQALNGLNPAAYTPDLTVIQELISSINVDDKTLE